MKRCGFKRSTIWIDEDKIETWECSRQGKHKFNDIDGEGEMMLCTQHYKIATKFRDITTEGNKMKLIHYELGGRECCCEKYESEEEFEKVNTEIERLWGKPIVNPQIDISKMKPRRYYISDKTTEGN